MRLFIDANIYLAFIKSSVEKFQSLEKLNELVSQRKIVLVFPKVTQDEVFRNAHSVAAGYCDEVTRQLPKKPQMAVSVRASGIQKKIDQLHQEYSDQLSELKNEYLKSVQMVIEKHIDLYVKEGFVPVEDDAIYSKAHKRYLIGNPPGKKINPIGDALAWELLLANCFDDDLIIVSGDGDWQFSQDGEEIKLNPFLNREWKQKTKKNISLYTTLGEFINTISKEKVIPETEIKKEKDANQRMMFSSGLSSLATGSSIDFNQVGQYVWSIPGSVGTSIALDVPSYSDMLASYRTIMPSFVGTFNELREATLVPTTITSSPQATPKADEKKKTTT